MKKYLVSSIKYLGKNRPASAASSTLIHNTDPLHLALFSGWLSVLITNFFGFSVVDTQIFLFLFPAVIFVSFQQYSNITMKQLRLPLWTVWLPVVIGLYLLVTIGRFWYADTRFASGYRYNRAGMFTKAAPLLTQAVSLNSGEPFYHDELSGSYASLSVAAAEAQNATQAATLAKQAVAESDTALTISPKNVNFWKTRTKVYYTLSSLDPSFNQSAIEALKQALSLSPNDPKIYYNLAILAGREGNNQEAINYLVKAKELKVNYRDAYWALAIFYQETKQTDLARDILQQYLDKINPDDKEFRQHLNEL